MGKNIPTTVNISALTNISRISQSSCIVIYTHIFLNRNNVNLLPVRAILYEYKLLFFLEGGGKKIFIVSKQKNQQKYKRLLYTTYIIKYKQHTT